MARNYKKPKLEVPEEELLEHFTADDEDDENKPVLPKSTRPDSVSEADWVDQQLDVPIDDDDETEYS